MNKRQFETTNDKIARVVPPGVMMRTVDRRRLIEKIAVNVALGDEDLLRGTQVCLRNLWRFSNEINTEPEFLGPDDLLRVVLVPELWERIRRGTRDELRRISTTLAEYRPDPERPSVFSRMLGAERTSRLRREADEMRALVERTSRLDTSEVVEQTRFAVAGSRAADRWSPETCVYDTGFTYQLVPAIAIRASEAVR